MQPAQLLPQRRNLPRLVRIQRHQRQRLHHRPAGVRHLQRLALGFRRLRGIRRSRPAPGADPCAGRLRPPGAGPLRRIRCVHLSARRRGWDLLHHCDRLRRGRGQRRKAHRGHRPGHRQGDHRQFGAAAGNAHRGRGRAGAGAAIRGVGHPECLRRLQCGQRRAAGVVQQCGTGERRLPGRRADSAGDQDRHAALRGSGGTGVSSVPPRGARRSSPWCRTP